MEWNGAGIFNGPGGKLTLQAGTRVANNKAGQFGGGIYTAGDGSQAQLLTGSRVEGNEAGSGGGGIYALTPSMVTLQTGVIICGNSAAQCTYVGVGSIGGPGTCPNPASGLCPAS
jgi:predicted outer membrane repeat protein